MLVMTNYAKTYASTVYQSLAKPSFIHPSPLFVKWSTTSSLPDQTGNQTITSFLGGSRIEIAFGSILIQRDLRFSDWYKAF